MDDESVFDLYNYVALPVFELLRLFNLPLQIGEYTISLWEMFVYTTVAEVILALIWTALFGD